MIRREMDEGAAWCLVPQIDHAHLAAEIAAHWRPLQDEEPAIRADLIAAVQHHDDGWCDLINCRGSAWCVLIECRGSLVRTCRRAVGQEF